MQDADGPNESRPSDRDDDREGIEREPKRDVAALQARMERLLDPSNVTSTSSSAMELAAQALTTAPAVRAQPGEERPRVSVASTRPGAGQSDLAARLREMEGTERTHPAGLGSDSARSDQGSEPSFDELRRAISEELPEDHGDDRDHRYGGVDDLKATLVDGNKDPFEPAYEEDEPGEAETIDAHAYRTRVRIVVLIQLVTAIACGLLALLHVTGAI